MQNNDTLRIGMHVGPHPQSTTDQSSATSYWTSRGKRAHQSHTFSPSTPKGPAAESA